MKKLFLIVLCFLLLFAFMVKVKGYSYNLVDQNQSADVGAQVGLRDEHPSDSGLYSSAGGWAIEANSSYTLGYVQIYGSRLLNPTSNIVMAIYNVTGTVGTNAKPTGNALVYSDLVPASSFPTANNWVSFNFTSSAFNVTNNVEYAFSMEVNTTGVDNLNYVKLRGSNNVTGRLANDFHFRNGAWLVLSLLYDFRFRIYAVTDITEPSINYLGFNSTLNGSTTQFTYNFSDNVGLSHFIHSWNNSGSWVNSTYAITGNQNQTTQTFTLNATSGVKVEYIIYVNDTSNLWGSTILQFFNTNTEPLIITVGEGFLIMGVFFLCGVFGIIGYIAYSKH